MPSAFPVWLPNFLTWSDYFSEEKQQKNRKIKTFFVSSKSRTDEEILKIVDWPLDDFSDLVQQKLESTAHV